MRVAQVQVTGAAASAALPLDPASVGGVLGVFLDVGAGCTCTVQITPDNVFDPNVVPVWYPTDVAALTGATADVAAGLTFGAVAIRINQTAGAAATVMKVVSRGIV